MTGPEHMIPWKTVTSILEDTIQEAVGIFYPIDIVPNYSILYLLAFIISLSITT